MWQNLRSMPPTPLALSSIQEILDWYEQNLCRVELRDPRGYRVRFKPENFVHLIKLKNKYRKEPRNLRLVLEKIKAGELHFVAGRFDPQRTAELSWASEIAVNPGNICTNWQALGRGNEAYVKDFGTGGATRFRVLVCKVVGVTRHVVTIFPRERIAESELRMRVWP